MKPKKTGKADKSAKPISAADRLVKKLPFKPTDGLTVAQIRKAVRDVVAQRTAEPNRADRAAADEQAYDLQAARRLS